MIGSSDEFFVDVFLIGVTVGIVLSGALAWLVFFKAAPKAYRRAAKRRDALKGRRAD